MMNGKYGPNTAEVEAYLALLPTLTAAAWYEARYEARGAAGDAAWNAGFDAAWDIARAAEALAVRDLITPEQFDILTAPMRAAGIDFDNLTNHTNGSE